MDKQKQIEEMSRELREIQPLFYASIAEQLYNAGYRKIPENAVVLNVSEYVRLKSIVENIDRVIKQKCKETAEKIFKSLFESIRYCDDAGFELLEPEKVIELAKQFGVKIKE